MVTVMEDTIPSGKEIAASPDFSVQERPADANLNSNKQQTSFCDPNGRKSSVETISQTYTDVEDTFEKTVSGNQKINDTEGGESSYLNLLLTAYVPLILLWFRRSMFGPANLIRSIVVGQLMRLVFVDNIFEWISEKLHHWLDVILFQSSTTGTMKCTNAGNMSAMLVGGTGKINPHAWPPPALTALALLTIFALVVHPDGLTWIMLGRLRDALYGGISILGQCLEYLLNDYGIIPTIIAATTLATMFFVVFVVIRTLSPKKTTNDHNKRNDTLHNERKKKKKKGGNTRNRREHHHNQNHHRSNKIKFSPPSQRNIGEETEDALIAASPCSPMPTQLPSTIEDHASLFPSSSSKDVTSSSISIPSLPILAPPTATNNGSNEDTENIINNKAKATSGMNKQKENRTRRRMMSGSTSDTTPLSDDQSCGSVSVRSFPSISVTSSRSSGGSMSKNNTKGSVSTPRRVKRQGISKSPKNTDRTPGKKKKSTSVESQMPSRWDALKPEHGNGPKGSNKPYNHNHPNGNAINKKQKQHQPQRHQKGSSRRTNGNGQNRKGRQSQRSVTNEKPMINRNPGVNIPVASSGSSLRVNNDRPKINDELPIVPIHQQQNSEIWSIKSNTHPILNAFPISSQLNSNPPPPPGFQKVSTAHGFEKESPNRHRVQQQVNNDFSVPTLFETAMTNRLEFDAQHSDFSRTKNVTSSQGRAAVIPPAFPSPSSCVSSSSGLLNGGTSIGTTIQENPFSSNIRDISSPSSSYNNVTSYQASLDSQIEADLQELGGQMAGSILDF